MAGRNGGIRDATGCQKLWMQRRASHIRDDCPLHVAGAKGLHGIGRGAGGFGLCILL